MELWVILTIISAMTFALKDVLVKKCFKDIDISPNQLVFEQYLFTFLSVLLISFPFINFFDFYNNLFLFFGKAATIGGSTLIYFYMLKKYEISLVSPLLNLSPLALLILSIFILSETVSIYNVIGLLIIIVGTYILEVHHQHHKKDKPHKFHLKQLFKAPSTFLLLAISVIILISFAAIFDKMILHQGISIFTNLYFTSLFLCLFLFIFLAREKRIKKTIQNLIYQPQTLVISLIGLLDQLVILSAISLPNALVSLIIPLRRTSTLFSSIFGGLLFHEKHLKKKLFATLIMVIGVFFIVL